METRRSFHSQSDFAVDDAITDRTNTRAQSTGESYRQFEGHLLRTQFQIND